MRFTDRWIVMGVLMGALSVGAGRLAAQVPDTVTLQFVNADLRAVVQGISRYLDKPLIAVGVPQVPVSFETPRGIQRAQLPGLLRNLVESQGLELTEDSISWRLRPKPPESITALGRAGGPGADSTTQLFVIRLKHAHAPDIAAAVNQLFGGGAEFSGHQGISRRGLSDQLREVPSPAPAATPTAPAPTGVASRSAALSGPVTIVPDEVTNSLLVRASQADFDVIKGAVDQLDIRPLQVLIEVTVVEARRDRTFTLGADATLPAQRVAGGTVSATTTGSGLSDLVVRLMRIGGGDVNAVIRAAQLKGDVEILSRPVLIAANNTESTFMVGEQRPFISDTRTLPNDNATQVNTFTYRDVGTRLTVLPTINYDGYVALEILQEINQATEEVAQGNPIISTREAHTQVLVKDGQTIVLGGLRDRQKSRNQDGVPLLSRIPLLGGLFGGASRHTSETELFLFLTPHILRTDDDIDRATTARLPAGIEGGR